VRLSGCSLMIPAEWRRCDRGGRLRSLIVTDSMIWNAETEYALAVASAEAAMGLDVTLAAPDGSAALAKAPTCVTLDVLPGASLARSPADLLAACRWVSAYTLDAPDTIVHSSRSSAHLAVALARAGSAKLVHLRGGAAKPSAGALNRYLYRRRTDAVIASSRRVESWVRERLGVPAGRIFRMYLPIDLNRFTFGVEATGADAQRVRHEFGIASDAPLVVNVARLAPIKGHEVLLDAWSHIAYRHPSALLLLVGEPWSGQPDGLRARASDLGVSASVRFTGRREDVPTLLAAADVCVCSSVGSEENSRAVSEYMAAGRAVVATRVGVIPELVVEGETGLLVAPSDARALADSLAGLLDDPARATAMGASGVERARELLSRESFAAGLAGVLSAVRAVNEGAPS